MLQLYVLYYCQTFRLRRVGDEMLTATISMYTSTLHFMEAANKNLSAKVQNNIIHAKLHVSKSKAVCGQINADITKSYKRYGRYFVDCAQTGACSLIIIVIFPLNRSRGTHLLSIRFSLFSVLLFKITALSYLS
jgi:hypothetical protein